MAARDAQQVAHNPAASMDHLLSPLSDLGPAVCMHTHSQEFY